MKKFRKYFLYTYSTFKVLTILFRKRLRTYFAPLVSYKFSTHCESSHLIYHSSLADGFAATPAPSRLVFNSLYCFKCSNSFLYRQACLTLFQSTPLHSFYMMCVFLFYLSGLFFIFSVLVWIGLKRFDEPTSFRRRKSFNVDHTTTTMEPKKKVTSEIKKVAHLPKNSPFLYTDTRDLLLLAFAEPKPLFTKAEKRKAAKLMLQSLPLLESCFRNLRRSLNLDLRQVAQQCRSGLQFLMMNSKKKKFTTKL